MIRPKAHYIGEGDIHHHIITVITESPTEDHSNLVKETFTLKHPNDHILEIKVVTFYPPNEVSYIVTSFRYKVV